MVVHYESCPFSRDLAVLVFHEDKFWELGNTSPEKVSQIPFPFYRKSISTMQICRSEVHPSASKSIQLPQSIPGIPGSLEASLKQLWSEFKTVANPALTLEDLMPIHIPWEKMAA
eukprot:Skav236335  [mRNA]  locus=scaffold97:301234:302966:- [translate_table: standard]